MRTPPLLLGAALLFWGWQTGLLAVALPTALALEGAQRVRWRWELSRADFNRVSDACAALLVALAVYQFATVDPTRAITGIFQWLPLVLFPLIVAQVLSTAGAVDASIFFWRLRAAAGPETDVTRVDLTYPYLAVVVLAASAANIRSGSFYAGLCALTTWALWRIRSPRYAVVPWLAALAVAAAVGWVGQVALAGLQRELERRATAWFLEMLHRDTDPFRSVTAIGDVGALKLSDRIVLRVDLPQGLRPPVLLAEATYNVYSAATWFATGAPFAGVTSQADGETWPIAPGPADAALTVSTYLRGGRGLLPLPNGTARLDRLVAASVARNRLGTVRVYEALGLVTYGAAYGPARDDPPTAEDLVVPAAEARTLDAVVADLGLRGVPPAAAVRTLQGWFLGRFRYSRFLPDDRVTGSAISDFLLRTRRGHCEYFATSTVLLLRAAGIPARYAVGYSVDEWSRLEGRWVARGRDAHAWALARVDGAWRAVDTTPPAWRAIETEAASPLRPLADLWSWLTYRVARWRWGERQDRLRERLGWLLVPLLALLAWRLWTRRRVAPAARTAGAVRRRAGGDSAFYGVERRLSALAFPRGPGEPLGEWLARVQASAPAGVATAPLPRLLDLHYRYRFDPRGLGSEDRRALEDGVAAWLAAHAGTPSR